jgi:hypothetical protein
LAMKGRARVLAAAIPMELRRTDRRLNLRIYVSSHPPPI